MKIGVLFVCLGNICRSPTAQGILENMAARAGVDHQLDIDSCGTAAFNVGKAPDPRAVAAAARAGYDITRQVARQIQEDDYRRFDYILAMDRQNLMNVKTWAPPDCRSEIRLLLEYRPPGGQLQVADPYYGSEDSFDSVIALLEPPLGALLEHIRGVHGLKGVIGQ